MVKRRINRSKIVLASGTFDLLHLGHIKYLEEAKKAGGENARLIVIVARDSTVIKRKKRRPIMPEGQRRALVESLKIVDEALLGYEDFDMEKVVEKIRPAIIAVGHDQEGLEAELRNLVMQKKYDVEVVKVSKFTEADLNSSYKIRKKIIQSFER